MSKKEKKQHDTSGKIEKRKETMKDLEVPEGQSRAVEGGRKAGKEQHEYMKVTMEDVLIT